jgi:hypothetical protein
MSAPPAEKKHQNFLEPKKGANDENIRAQAPRRNSAMQKLSM